MKHSYLWAPEPKPAERDVARNHSHTGGALDILLRTEGYFTPSALQNSGGVDKAIKTIESWVLETAFPDSILPSEFKIYIHTGSVDANTNTSDGTHPMLALTKRLASTGCKIVPVTGYGRNFIFDAAFRDAIEFNNGYGAVLINAEIFKNSEWKQMLRRTIANSGQKAADLDLVINWGEITGLSLNASKQYTREILMQLLDLGPWRHVFTLQGASPNSEYRSIDGTISHPRNDWNFGIELMSIAEDHGINIGYGDFGTRGEAIRQPLKIRYRGRPKYVSTLADKCLYTRGSRVDPDNPGKHYREFVQDLTRLEGFDPNFCEGNKFLSRVSNGYTEIKGNQKLIFAQEDRRVSQVLQDLNNLDR